MKRWQIILIIVLVALFCGCAGSLLGFAIGEQIGERTNPVQIPEPTVDIVIAAQAIESGMVIQPEMLTTISIPERILVEAEIRSYEDVVGGYALYDIPQGVPITRSMIYFTAP